MEIIYQLFNKDILYKFNLYYVIINLLSIQYILSYQQLYPTDFQSLNLGSCIKNDGDLFCQMYRRNSFCSIQHDECFCLPGYVSIYEMNDSWYTCKPLLTDLYCRIDSDCSYIHGSICHPGVGACVCPSGYEFVFQHFSCLPRVNDSSNPFCTACQRIDGVCVLNNRKNGLLLNNYYQDDLQCACPRKPNITVIKKYSFLDICNPIPVDIGEECNHINKVCLSQKAICLENSINIRQTQPTTNRNVNICVCHEGMIPVYQKNLDYFECYINWNNKKINIESDQGSEQGKQLSRFHIKRKDCIEYLLQITCNQESIHICFKNPYQTSMIRTNHRSRSIQVYLDTSMIFPQFIQNEFNYSIDDQKCYLIKQNNHNHDEYCLLINFNQFNELRQCGIYEISYKYGSVFYGTLHAEITKNEVSLLRNVHIDFVCHINVSYLNGSNLSTSYFYDRSITFKKRNGQLALPKKSPGINKFLTTKYIEKLTLQDERTRNTSSSSISLSIINLNKNISQNHEMTLKISSSLSEFILIEYCLVKGQSIPSKILPTYEHEKLLDLKCFNTNIHRIKQMIDIYNNNLIEYQCILFKRIIHHRTSNKNHSIWISQSFHLNNISLYNTVYSTCLIRVCQIEQLCTYAEFYSLNRTNKQYNDPYVQSKVYIPLIMLNDNNNYRNKSKLSHLFPPINFNNLIQFYFIQSTLQINQTNINIQLNDSIDVYFKHSTINANRSLEYVWIKYILGISIFTLMCQIMIFSFKHLKKCYTKYKLVNHRNPFIMTAVTIIRWTLSRSP
ncbi:unnamed protein product [Schistosoma mattheei]|uniref:Uncharacterized protein n=1 Tax=Schistosoma mattheei TaxID=31246 RepID=A0AA85BSH5_9TREM|nr:unnamed protein product [Schistosoma mattheei]